jgi:hypothetical protein
MKFNVNDLADSSSIARSASSSFYPSGAPLKTSYSVNGDATRTLTQRDLQSVLGRRRTI